MWSMMALCSYSTTILADWRPLRLDVNPPFCSASNMCERYWSTLRNCPWMIYPSKLDQQDDFPLTYQRVARKVKVQLEVGIFAKPASLGGWNGGDKMWCVGSEEIVLWDGRKLFFFNWYCKFGIQLDHGLCVDGTSLVIFLSLEGGEK